MLAGKYKVNKQLNIGLSGCAFTLKKGAEIEVRQIDELRRKALIDFGGRMIGWFSESWLERNASAV
jgi:hypothetical protein